MQSIGRDGLRDGLIVLAGQSSFALFLLTSPLILIHTPHTGKKHSAVVKRTNSKRNGSIVAIDPRSKFK